ncbi:hypothetical protein ARNL5_01756 [Anaerolineae bacterium]|nr:hypothetical protein ARNL5_01756 [Anaerolineae bacterium]
MRSSPSARTVLHVEGAVLTHRHLEMVEGLFELDPLRTYPRRAGEHVAELVGASGFRLELDEAVVQSNPAPGGTVAASLPIRIGNKGGSATLHLYGSPLEDDAMALARFATRLLGRGLRYAKRLGSNPPPRTAADLQVLLERTPLTPRERDVVGRLLAGASTRQIASSTGLTVATVNTYLKRIFAKLGVHSRVELLARVTGSIGVVP